MADHDDYTLPMRVPTAGELRRMTRADIALLRRETDNQDILYLLSLVETENSRMGGNPNG